MTISSYLSGAMMEFSKSSGIIILSLLAEWICFIIFAGSRFSTGRPIFLRSISGYRKENAIRIFLALLLLGGNFTLQYRFWPISLHCLSQMILWSIYLCLRFGAGWHSAVFESSIFCLLTELGKSLYRGGTSAYLLHQFVPGLTQMQLCRITYGIYLACLAVFTLFFAKHRGMDSEIISQMTSLQSAGLLFPLILYLFIRQFQSGLEAGISANMHLYLEIISIAVAVCAVIVIVTTISMLRTQKSRNELLIQNMIARQQHSQYLIQKEALEAVGRRYHDLKHYLTALESVGSNEEMKQFAREMQGEIRAVETIQETGNEVMNVLLSQRIRECQDKAIRFIPYIDGRNLDRISTIDLCTLFGNAMDNAVEASLRISDPEQREISVKVENYGDLIIFRFLNRFMPDPGSTAASAQGADSAGKKNGPAAGSFPTTKPDTANHGYGLPSIRTVAEKYGGSVTADAKDGVFELVAVIPGKVPA